MFYWMCSVRGLNENGRPKCFRARVTWVCCRLHFHFTSISLCIFSSSHGCIPFLQIQMDVPRTDPETLQTNWVGTENSHSSENKTCLSQEQTSRFGSVGRAVSRVDKEHHCFRWFWRQHWFWKRLKRGALIWKSSNSCVQIVLLIIPLAYSDCLQRLCDRPCMCNTIERIHSCTCE